MRLMDDGVGMRAVPACHFLCQVAFTNNRSLSGNAMQPSRCSEGLHRNRDDQQPQYEKAAQCHPFRNKQNGTVEDKALDCRSLHEGSR